MEYRYTAATVEGSAINGVVVADTVEGAERILWDSGLTIIELRKRIKMPTLHEALPSLFGVKRRDVIGFSRSLANLLEAGIPILRALTIQSRFGNRAFRDVLSQVIVEVEKGARLSEACGKFPHAFPEFYVYLLRTGEEVGTLSEVLKERTVRSRRRSVSLSNVATRLSAAR